MKICSLYGVGFYYIPGTDMCLKVGGYVRAQAEWGSTQGLPFGSTYNGLYTRQQYRKRALRPRFR